MWPRRGRGFGVQPLCDCRLADATGSKLEDSAHNSGFGGIDAPLDVSIHAHVVEPEAPPARDVARLRLSLHRVVRPACTLPPLLRCGLRLHDPVAVVAERAVPESGPGHVEPALAPGALDLLR